LNWKENLWLWANDALSRYITAEQGVKVLRNNKCDEGFSQDDTAW
jgi:hypothetical protein